jgi:uncharacterized membrane protein
MEASKALSVLAAPGVRWNVSQRLALFIQISKESSFFHLSLFHPLETLNMTIFDFLREVVISLLKKARSEVQLFLTSYPVIVFIFLAHLIVLYIPDDFFYGLFDSLISANIPLAHNFARNMVFYDRAYVSFFIALASFIVCPFLTNKVISVERSRFKKVVGVKESMLAILFFSGFLAAFLYIVLVNSRDSDLYDGFTNVLKPGFLFFYGLGLPLVISHGLAFIVLCIKEIRRCIHRS